MHTVESSDESLSHQSPVSKSPKPILTKVHKSPKNSSKNLLGRPSSPFKRDLEVNFINNEGEEDDMDENKNKGNKINVHLYLKYYLN